MLDIGGWEFLLIAVLGIVVIGPKELPGVVRTVSGFVRKAREMAREFHSGLEDIARETELQNIADEMKAGMSPGAAGGDLWQEVGNAIDPRGEIRDSLDGAAPGEAADLPGDETDDERMARAGHDGDDGSGDAGAPDAGEGAGDAAAGDAERAPGNPA